MAHGQPWQVVFDESDLYKRPELRNLEVPAAISDSLILQQFLRSLLQELTGAGYLAASIDSVAVDSALVKVSVYQGERYDWTRIEKGNVPDEYLQKTGFRERFYTGKPFKPAEAERILASLLSHCENIGYPFAELRFDSVAIQPGSVSARLRLSRGDFVAVDSLIVKGNIKTSQNYLRRYLGITRGMAFDQSLLNTIPMRLRELPFASVIKPFEVGMRRGKADIYLYLDNRKASNFDGVLGIQPDNITGDVIVTGDVQFNIMNGLRQGEAINMRWQRLQSRTQQLDLKFEYPYIFKSPLGVDFKLNIYRRDTLFSQLNAQAGVNLFFRGPNSVGLFLSSSQNNIISTQSFQPGIFADSRSTLAGATASTRNLDYRFNPRRGYDVKISFAAGTRRVLINPSIDDTLYNGINTNSDLFHIDFHLREFIPLGKRSTVLLSAKGASLVNDNLFRNEAFRIGGLKSLRGFDEQSIFATSYAVVTAEYRYLLEQNSNLFLFIDQSFYEDTSAEEYVRDNPIGFGAGISFETRVGIFSLTYALGRQFDNEIAFSSGKVHFGFASFF